MSKLFLGFTLLLSFSIFAETPVSNLYISGVSSDLLFDHKEAVNDGRSFNELLQEERALILKKAIKVVDVELLTKKIGPDKDDIEEYNTVVVKGEKSTLKIRVDINFYTKFSAKMLRDLLSRGSVDYTVVYDATKVSAGMMSPNNIFLDIHARNVKLWNKDKKEFESLASLMIKKVYAKSIGSDSGFGDKYGYYQFGRYVSRQSWWYELDKNSECVKTDVGIDNEKVDGSKCFGHIIAKKIAASVGKCEERETYPRDISLNTVEMYRVDSNCLCTKRHSKGFVNSYEHYYYGDPSECLELFPDEQKELVNRVYSGQL